VAVGDVGRANQEIVGEFEVALGIGGRGAEGVDPEEGDLVPGEWGGGKDVEKELGAGAAGDGEGGEILAGDGFVEAGEDVVGAGLGGGLCRGKVFAGGAYLWWGLVGRVGMA